MNQNQNQNQNQGYQNQNRTQQPAYAQIHNFSVSRVSNTSGTIRFNLSLNDITIYGCKIQSNRQTGHDFVGMPSVKYADGSWHNVLFVRLSQDDHDMIIEEVLRVLNNG